MHKLSHGFDGGVLGRWGGKCGDLAESRQIRGQHGMPGLPEMGRLGVPHAVIEGKAVNEEDGVHGQSSRDARTRPEFPPAGILRTVAPSRVVQFILEVMNIVLIGYRGSGKSSIGQKLAQLLWMDFVDTDNLIVERAGKNIREIFEMEGESGFRDRESAMVAEVAAKDNLVIAAGGGVVLRGENVAALKKNGKILWLKASAETLFKRIQADAASNLTRPNLTAAGGLEEVKMLLEERTPCMREPRMGRWKSRICRSKMRRSG